MLKNIQLLAFAILTIYLVPGCKKFLDLPLPTDRLTADGVYISDAAAGAVLTGILANASTNNLYGSASSNDGINLRTSLYADDLFLLNPGGSNNTYNNLLPFYADNIGILNLPQWSALYKQLFLCNSAIEGVTANQQKLPHKNQWLGEALFFRAFTYLDLIGLYGDVVLTTTSDYQQNNTLKRIDKTAIYQQMIEDLKNAETMLEADYVDGNSVVSTNRIRPNRYAATALLARVYLYTGDWANAEAEATKVIDNTALYKLEAPASVFLKGSGETLFAIVPYTGTFLNATITYVRDYDLFNAGVPATVPDVAALGSTYTCLMPVSNSLLGAFEPGDARFSNWLKKVTTINNPVNGVFYFPNKYKTNIPDAEYNVVFRLSEQYLVRAEARAHLSNLTGAAEDINTIRKRAKLDPTNATTQVDLLIAVAKERRIELFTEWGHRFYDLKRTGQLAKEMEKSATEKSNNTYTNTPVTWNDYKQYWPIPSADILANPGLTQTPGYQ